MEYSLNKSRMELRHEDRDKLRALKDEWLERHIKFMQIINDTSTEEYCIRKSAWVLRENDEKWVDCFKKTTVEKPFKSEELLKMIS